jgi:UDP-N-acetylglucosamine 1-carboxyvinyltransferase
MQKILIEGGERLKGEVAVSGAKNAVLPILAATLLAAGEFRIRNVPRVVDVTTILRLLEQLGAHTGEEGDILLVDTRGIKQIKAPYDLVRTMRASILVLGPLLARLGKAEVSLPGGCAIGARPINLHLMGLEKMGAQVRIAHGYVEAEASRLQGTPIYLDLPTVTGTEQLMTAATLAEGTTVLENAACEPEVADLAAFLNAMGARIAGAGTDRITIEGVTALHGTEYAVMPDRVEAGTFLVAGAITGGEVKVKGCNPSHLDALVLKLRETGADILEETDGLRVRGTDRPRAVDVKTLPYPGFPTDMQAQMVALMTLSDGLSVITETIFESRFAHIAELRRMGADIRIQGPNAIVRGVPALSGAPVMATDLRASASLVLAGLAARGETEVLRIYHLDRGYERIEEKLAQLGGRIRRVDA